MELVTQAAVATFFNGLSLGKKGSGVVDGGAVEGVGMRADYCLIEALGARSKLGVINDKL